MSCSAHMSHHIRSCRSCATRTSWPSRAVAMSCPRNTLAAIHPCNALLSRYLPLVHALDQHMCVHDIPGRTPHPLPKTRAPAVPPSSHQQMCSMWCSALPCEPGWNLPNKIVKRPWICCWSCWAWMMLKPLLLRLPRAQPFRQPPPKMRRPPTNATKIYPPGWSSGSA